MISKIKYIIWFVLRPKYYKHFFSLIIRKFLTNHDTTQHKIRAQEWAARNVLSYFDALKKIDIRGNLTGLDDNTIAEAKKLELNSSVTMGGGSHIHLLYDCVRSIRPKKVIETGVAYGWSSLAILKGLADNNYGNLYSVDMPYPTKKNEKDVGIVVPEYLRKNWTLIRKPDNPGILDALSKAEENFDLCHYDSDKSWWGRKYAYLILWKSLNSKGIFISDDINDNLYFSEFVKIYSVKYAVIKYQGKFVGIIRKP